MKSINNNGRKYKLASNFVSTNFNNYQNPTRPVSTADTCKNCAKCGKGFKTGTNEAYGIKIKIRVGGISRIFYFRSYTSMAASDKGISLKRKFLESFYLTS